MYTYFYTSIGPKQLIAQQNEHLSMNKWRRRLKVQGDHQKELEATLESWLVAGCWWWTASSNSDKLLILVRSLT